MPEPSKQDTAKRRPFLRWAGRVLVAGLFVLVLLLVFHRPLLLWALNRLGPEAARRAGVELQWQVEGSLWSDLEVNNLRTTVQGHVIRVQHLGLRYDLAPAWQGDWFKIPKGITVHDVNAVIDLSTPSPAVPKAAASAPSDPKELGEMLKKLVLPDIDLQHITVTVLMPDGSAMLNDLSLVIPSGKEGTLSIGSVEHQALVSYPLHDIQARVKLSGTSLRITTLKLPPQLEVEELNVDAGAFDQGKIALTTKIRSGKAGIGLAAKADVRGDHPLVDATVDVTGVDEQEAGMWLPSVPEWKAKINKLRITAKGDPMDPRAFDAAVSLEVTNLGYQQWKGDSFNLEAGLAKGRLEVSQLAAVAGGNRIEATTQAEAPSDWAGFAKTPLRVQWKIDAPTLQSLAGLPVKVSGGIKGEGDVQIDDQGLRHFAATLGMRDLALDQNKLRTLDAKASGDLKSLAFEARALATAGDGQLDVHGNLGLAAGMPSDAAWKLVLPQPEALVRSLGIAWPADVAAGEVRTEGSASFELAKLQASQFNEAKGAGILSLKQIAWRGAPCPQVSAGWKVEQGRASLSHLDVELPGANHVHAEGGMELAGKQAFDGSLSVTLPDLAALQPWVAAGTMPATPAPSTPAPALRGGSVSLEWKGSGVLKDALALQGETSLKVDQVRLDTLPEAASLTTHFTHDLEGASVTDLSASFGPWAASLHGTVAKTGLDIAGIEASHGGKKLVTGEIKVPLDLQAIPVPVNQTKPLHIRIATEGRLSLKELAELGKSKLPPELSGFLSATIGADGTLQAPEVRVEVKGEELHLPKVPGKDPGQVSLLVTLKDGAFAMDNVVAVKPLEPLSIHATAHLDVPALLKNPAQAMETPFEATVKLDQPSLAFLVPLVPMLDDLRGSLKVDASAKGTARNPRVQGSVVIEVPTLQPHDPDLPLIKALKAKITVDGTLVKVESFSAVVAGGDVSIHGSCDLKDMTKPGFDVTLKARDLLAVRNEMMSLRTDADISCKGVPSAAAVTGSIGLTRGRVFQEVNFLPLTKMMNDLPPLPDAEAHALQASAGSASPLPPSLAAWTFDVGLKTKDPIRLLGNVLNGGVNIDLKVGGNGSAPQVIGGVNLSDAVLNLPFSTLRVKEGVVSFVKDHPFTPTLQLEAESTVDVYDVVLRGYGSALDPKIRFTSTPPLAEGEIATLLATGATTSGLQKAGDDAAGRALLFLVREAYRRAFISKSKPLKKGEKPSESRFIVQERSENGALGGVTGIYEFSRKMKIVGSTDKDGGFRAMLHYLFRFD